VADLATRVQRVSARTGDASDADVEVARKQETFVTGPVTWSRVDAAGSPAQTSANARAAIG
jgi:predicted kinase